MTTVNPVSEALARHLRLNFVPGTTSIPWEQASPEERDVWLTEADHFLEVAQRAALKLMDLEFVEGDVAELPSKWSQPRSD